MINTKKSQTELLGIAIVVIILSIGILIIVSNSLKKSKATEQKREFSEKQLATNMLGAILSTTTNCNGDKISTLLIDCGGCNGINCPSCPGGQEAEGLVIPYNTPVCDYLNITISHILNQTLKSWNKKYHFLAYTSINDPVVNISEGTEQCLRQGSYIQKDFYYLPLYPNTLTVELGLCS